MPHELFITMIDEALQNIIWMFSSVCAINVNYYFCNILIGSTIIDMDSV